MELDTLPTSMIVIGGNAIGLEQAQLWNRLGVEVTVVEALELLAPFEEPDVSAVIEEVFTREGIGVVTGATITRTDHDHDGYRVALTGADGQPGELRAEQLLVATGRRPVTAGLNLAAVGVKTGRRGEVVVDEYLRQPADLGRRGRHRAADALWCVQWIGQQAGRCTVDDRDHQPT